METTFKKKVKGCIMEQIFEGTGTNKLSVRHYKALNVSDADYDSKKDYTFEITIRHPEGTQAQELFNAAERNIKSKQTT